MAQAITTPLLDLFPHSVTVEVRTGQDEWGEPTYASGTARTARVSGGQRIVRDPTGQEQVSTTHATFPADYGLTVLDRYTLPSDFDPQQPEPLMVKRVSDENGIHHERVFFK